MELREFLSGCPHGLVRDGLYCWAGHVVAAALLPVSPPIVGEQHDRAVRLQIVDNITRKRRFTGAARKGGHQESAGRPRETAGDVCTGKARHGCNPDLTDPRGNSMRFRIP